MSNFGKNGSVTFQKKRYNDDFNLYSVTDSSIRKGFCCPFDIVYDRDLSFSFFLRYNTIQPSGHNPIIYSTNEGFPHTGSGILFNVNRISFITNTQIFFLTNVGELVADNLYHITLNYKNVSQSLDVYVNSQFLRNVVIGYVVENSSFSSFYAYMFANANYRNFQGVISEISIFHKNLTQAEISEIYYKKNLPSSTHESCQLHLPLNNIPSVPKSNIAYGKNILGDTFNAGIIFQETIIGDGYVEFDLLNSLNLVLVGLTDSVTNPTPSWNPSALIDFGINATSVGFSRYLLGVSLSLSTPRLKFDTVKIERIGTTYNFYINNVLKSTTTGSTVNLRPCISMYGGFQFVVANVRLNGVEIKTIQDSQDATKGLGFLDVSSNYDYAKTVPLVKQNHGFLAGFTDEELGVGIGLNPPNLNWNAYSDFYNKGKYYGQGISFMPKNSLNLEDMRNYRGSTPFWSNATVPPSFLSGYTYVFKIFADATMGEFGDIFSPNGGTELNNIALSKNYFILFGNTTGTTTETATKLQKKVTTVAFKFNHIDKQYKIYVDGVFREIGTRTNYTNPISLTTQGRIGSLFSNRRLRTLYYIGIFDGELTDEECKKHTIDDDWLTPKSKPLVGFWTLQNNGTHYIDLANNGLNAQISHATNFANNHIPKDQTGKPPIRHGLQFNGTNQYLSLPSFNPPKTKGYTIVTVYKTATNGFICSKNNGTTNGFSEESLVQTFQHRSVCGGDILVRGFNANQVDKLTISATKMGDVNNRDGKQKGSLVIMNELKTDSNSANILSNGFNDIGGDFVIGASSYPFLTGHFNGVICYLAIFEGVLVDEEIKRLWNNGLLMNAWDISPITNSKLVLYPDFNNPYLNGSVLQIPDLSPSNYPIIANGWADLTTLQNSRVVINSLR